MSHVQCCICESFGIDVHHIVPQAEGGTADIDNAAPLCPTCHRTHGGNPELRKQLRERRDVWYAICRQRVAAEWVALERLNEVLTSQGQTIKAEVSELRSQTLDRLLEVERKLDEIRSHPTVLADPILVAKVSGAQTDLAVSTGSFVASGSGGPFFKMNPNEVWCARCGTYHLPPAHS